MHHLREARHLEDLIDLRADIHDLQIGMLLAQTQQHAQPRRGEILQRLGIDRERVAGVALQQGGDLLLRCGGVRRVDAPREGEAGFVFLRYCHGKRLLWVIRS